MDNYKHLKNILHHIIVDIDDSHSLFCENPDTDFTRSRKLDFKTTISSIISMEAGSLKDELYKFFNHSLDTPTSSAFVQSRNKIKIEAFRYLFDFFNKKTYDKKLFKGYRLLAVDGSEHPIDNTFQDNDTTIRNCNQSGKSYSVFHLNASYDLLECTYDDLIIYGQAKMNENDTFCQIVDRYKSNKAIFIADRGYESYNGFEHVVKYGNKYLIRVKDIYFKKSMAKSLGPFSDDEFDTDVTRVLNLKNTNMVKACLHYYKWCPRNMRFDYMSKEDPWYEFNCRIVRFKITEDTYECIITNLDRNEFSIEDIKEPYNKRWGIETSFRQVKYTIGLNSLHAKKRKLIQQEIYARLTLYNLIQRVIQKIKIPKKKRNMYIK